MKKFYKILPSGTSKLFNRLSLEEQQVLVVITLKFERPF